MKKVNFLGIEMNVIDEAAIDEAEKAGELHTYMVLRVVDTEPNVGSPDLLRRRRRTPCEGCREICWIDPKSYEEIARLKHEILCSHCMLAKVKKEEEGRTP